MAGLFKVTGQLKNGLIAKSLADGKNIPVYASHKVSALEDISVFCESDDIPLKDVFQKIKDKENGGAALDTKKADDKAIIAYFGEVLTDYDRDRVYKSDMRKIINWYNLLQANDLLKDEAPVESEENDKAEEALKTFKDKAKGSANVGAAGGDKVGSAQTKGGKTTTVRKTGI
jgi:hypothetical protein